MKLLCIWTAPEGEDAYEKRTFAGLGGRYVREVLEKIRHLEGWEIDLQYVCSKLHYDTPKDSDADNVDQLRQAVPHYDSVVLLGPYATKHILHTKGYQNLIGHTYGNMTVNYDPIAVIKNSKLHNVFVDILYKAVGRDKTPTDPPFMVCSPEQIIDLIKRHVGPIVLDLETYQEVEEKTPDPYKAIILCAGFHLNGGIYITDTFTCSLARELGGRTIVVHNADFEWQIFKHQFGIEPTVIDTIETEYLTDPRRGAKRGLKFLASIYFGAPDWDSELKPMISRLHLVDRNLVHKYLAWDVEMTKRLWDKHRNEIVSDDKLSRCFEEILLPGSLTLQRMQYRGVRIDFQELEELNAKYQLQEEKLYDELAEEMEGNPRSVKDLSNFLFSVRNYKQIEGKSTSRHVVEELAKKYDDPFLHRLLDWRKVQKIRSTYLVGLVKHVAEHDLRIHTEFRFEGTETGRLSSMSPNLQNIPRGPEIRGLFIPDEGHFLVTPDYSQLEVRVGAFLSGDEKMIAATKGRDIHREFASAIFNKPADQITKEERHTAKILVFGGMYFMSPGAASYQLGVSRERGKELLEMLWAAFPEYFGEPNYWKDDPVRLGWARRFGRECQKNHCVETYFGRRRHFTLITYSGIMDVIKQSVNCAIQGTASDICLRAAIRADRELPDLRLHILVHDQIIASVPDASTASSLAAIMQETGLPTDVPFPVEYDLVERWS